MSFHMKNAYARRGYQAAFVSLFALLASVAHADWETNAAWYPRRA